MPADTPREPVSAPAQAGMSGLPHPLTFFLTSRQRRAVLAALRRHHRDRVPALLAALGLDPPAARQAAARRASTRTT